MDALIITTYNRVPQVESLVKSIQEVFTGKIFVYNDGGEKPNLSGCHLLTAYENHGKKNYYRLITDIFQMLRGEKFERFWMLPDDVTISPDLFTESIRLWDAIKDERKICLSVGHTHGRHKEQCWTYFDPINMGEVYLTNWNDLCFMAERLFLEELNYEIEKPLNGYDYRSSGVGRYISRTLHNKKWNMYHVDKSLVEFIPMETQMHREKQPA